MIVFVHKKKIIVCLLAVLNVVISPSNAFVLPGSSVTFRCDAYSNQPESSLEYSWEYPNQPDPNIAVTNNILTVEDVSQESEGTYRCTVRENNTEIVLSATATLTIGNW